MILTKSETRHVVIALEEPSRWWETYGGSGALAREPTTLVKGIRKLQGFARECLVARLEFLRHIQSSTAHRAENVSVGAMFGIDVEYQEITAVDAPARAADLRRGEGTRDPR